MSTDPCTHGDSCPHTDPCTNADRTDSSAVTQADDTDPTPRAVRLLRLVKHAATTVAALVGVAKALG